MINQEPQPYLAPVQVQHGPEGAGRCSATGRDGFRRRNAQFLRDGDLHSGKREGRGAKTGQVATTRERGSCRLASEPVLDLEALDP